MRTKKEIYKVLFDAVRKELSKQECKACEGHKKFARVIPNPRKVSEEEAATLSAMVVCSPSNDWGLEGFFQTVLPSGEKLGDFVRNNLPNYNQYNNLMEDVAKKYFP
jgi:hypothetical protein